MINLVNVQSNRDLFSEIYKTEINLLSLIINLVKKNLNQLNAKIYSSTPNVIHIIF